MDKKIILLVEDNADDIDLTLRAFKKTGIPCDVVVVRDGVEAVTYLIGSNPPPLPNIVLLDLKLPRLDGLEVLRQLRDHPRTRLLPVVMLTSSAEHNDMVQSYECGANSYIRKPVNFTEFIESVQQIGMYWLGINDLPEA